MVLIYNQLKSLSTFLIILILLLISTIIFNLNYHWDGVTIIVRIYIFIFSFYLMYNFSLFHKEDVRARFENKIQWKRDLRAFLEMRIAPFIAIVCVTVIFTFIDYLGSSDWPMKPFLEILNGRYSNTMIYSLLLLLVLRMRKGPSVTIPFFLISSIVYFLIDKTAYAISDPGYAISLIKIVKVHIFVLLLLVEYYYPKIRLVFYNLIAFAVSMGIYLTITGITMSVYSLSNPIEFTHTKSGHMLMSLGYSFPLDSYAKTTSQTGNLSLARNLVYFSNKYNKSFSIGLESWSKILISAPVNKSDLLFKHLLKNKIEIPRSVFISFLRINAIQAPEKLLISRESQKYATFLFRNHGYSLRDLINSSSVALAYWGIDVLTLTGKLENMPFLITKLSDMNPAISVKAYGALKTLTGEDPALAAKLEVNSPYVIEYFQSLYNKRK